MVILGSKSPRRKELLGELIKEFIIIPPLIDEYLYPFESLSLEKAKVIAKDNPDAIIISADTIVIKDNVVYGKPKDKLDAFRMLKELSNNVHEVKTVYTIYSKNKGIELTRIVTSKVYFNDLSNELILRYCDTLSPLDKAGAYGIQDKDFNLVNKIEGSYTNIVGLPVDELKEDLIKLKIIA
jgi:septum formation protein